MSADDQEPIEPIEPTKPIEPIEPAAQIRFLERLSESLEEGAAMPWVKVSLGNPVGKEGALKWLLKPAEIRGERRCVIVERWARKDVTRHVPVGETAAVVREALGSRFLSAVLFTEGAEFHLDLARKPKLRVVEAARGPAVLGHDRVKARKLEARAPWLAKLGVTDAKGQGKVRERMGDKFRQIERFLDLLDAACRDAGLLERREGIRLWDMGAGKGYLTFAAADYLSRRVKAGAGEGIEVVGVELRQELVVFCNAVAKECGMGALRFEEGAIGQLPAVGMDVLVALHACNTATDEAIAAGVRGGARAILVAPCCHQEARRQVDEAGADRDHPLHDLLRHGLFAERQAEMVTDALRVLLLEREGYRVRVCEFVAAEHTAKNVLISAVKDAKKGEAPGNAVREELTQRIERLKKFYGIRHHRLEEYLMAGH